ncbi:MAG: hypothetical protein AABX25_04565 [Nanoarchaeota archaeon]
MSFNKRASLEISIQAIVIVVLAMTILGLGLGFVRGLFKNISSTTEDVTEQVRQKILDDLITSDKKLSFPKTEVILDKGGSTVMSIGVRNKKDSEMSYKLKFVPISNPDGFSFDIDSPKQWFQLQSYSTQNFKIAPADSRIHNIRLSIPSDIPKSGSYLLNFEVWDDADSSKPYDSKDFYVVVRG